MKDKFNLEKQYLLYLSRMGLSEQRMHPQQKIQLKQAFMGACGQMLMLLRDDVGALEENEAVKVMEGMISEVGNFFISETKRNN